MGSSRNSDSSFKYWCSQEISLQTKLTLLNWRKGYQRMLLVWKTSLAHMALYQYVILHSVSFPQGYSVLYSGCFWYGVAWLFLRLYMAASWGKWEVEVTDNFGLGSLGERMSSFLGISGFACFWKLWKKRISPVLVWHGRWAHLCYIVPCSTLLSLLSFLLLHVRCLGDQVILHSCIAGFQTFKL